MDISLERFFVKITLVVALVAATITSLVEIVQFQGFVTSLLIDLGILLIILIAFVFYYRNQLKFGSILVISSLLILMSYEIASEAFLKQGSMSVFLVVSLANSIIFRGHVRLFMHTCTFLLLFSLIMHLHFYAPPLPNDGSYITTAINISVIYFIIGITSLKLKNRYDQSLKKVSELNRILLKQVSNRDIELPTSQTNLTDDVSFLHMVSDFFKQKSTSRD